MCRVVRIVSRRKRGLAVMLVLVVICFFLPLSLSISTKSQLYLNSRSSTYAQVFEEM